MIKKIFAAAFLFFASLQLHAQSNINPDISLIGTFNTFTNFIKGTPEYGKLNFEDPSMELFVDGYLNPFARASANISYEEGALGVEELFGNIVRGLPFDMQIKAGKFLVGFGKLNTSHPHTWPFLNRPLFHRVFFGEEGFNDIGINFSFLLPTGDLFTNLDLGIFKGSSIIPLTDLTAVNRGINPVFVGRLGTFWPLDDYTNMEIGVSGSYGIYSKEDIKLIVNPMPASFERSLNYLYGGLDFKLKYSPDAYSVLTLQGEAIINNRDVIRRSEADALRKITNSGAFIYADYKFDKQFSFGVKYDYTAGIVDEQPTFMSLNNDDINSTHGFETWFSYYPVEETTVVRLGVQHLSFNYGDGTKRDGETTIKLQLMFSLGPHKAHPF